MKAERRFYQGTCELRNADTDTPCISGYAAVFYRSDDPGSEFALGADIVERIMPGAFDAISADDVRALFNHDSNHVLGRSTSGTLKLTVDDKGLRYDIDLPNTQLARDLRESISRGDISGSSFAFTIPEGGQEYRDEGEQVVREVRAVKLYDVGPVTYPSYEASTSHARSEVAAWREAQQEPEEDDPAPTAIARDVVRATARLAEVR